MVATAVRVQSAARSRTNPSQRPVSTFHIWLAPLSFG